MINMTLSIEQLLDKTKRTQYVGKDVLSTCPDPKRVGKLYFFTLGEYITNDELEKEYESRGLVPASVREIAVYDIKNRDEMDEMMYVGTHWKDAKGNWCFATFDRWYGRRVVSVHRHVYGWYGNWWFAGVRKSSTKPSND